MDDDRPIKTGFPVGEDLYGVSISELEERITLLGEEIIRLQAEVEKKRKERDAADQLFG